MQNEPQFILYRAQRTNVNIGVCTLSTLVKAARVCDFFPDRCFQILFSPSQYCHNMYFYHRISFLLLNFKYGIKKADNKGS